MIGKETYTEVTAELLQSWHIPLHDQEQREHHWIQQMFKSTSIWRPVPVLWNFKRGHEKHIWNKQNKKGLEKTEQKGFPKKDKPGRFGF